MESSSNRSPWKDSVLGRLGIETILEITSHLPLSSAASFAFSCHSAYSILGSSYWKKLGLTDISLRGEREELLDLLARDMPDHISCYFCEQLHTVDEQQTPHHVRNTLFKWKFHNRPCQCVPTLSFFNPEVSKLDDYHAPTLGEMQTFDFYRSGFSYGLFQMVMKREREGLKYTHLMRQLALGFESTPYDEEAKLSREDRSASEFRIVSGSMYLRKRTEAFLIYQHDQECYYTRFSSSRWGTWLRTGGLCWHMLYSFHYYGADLENSITEEICYARKGAKSLIGSIHRCTYCPSEFLLECIKFGENDYKLVFTTWLELGEGRTPLDPDWVDRLKIMERHHRDPYYTINEGGRYLISEVDPETLPELGYEVDSYFEYESSESESSGWDSDLYPEGPPPPSPPRDPKVREWNGPDFHYTKIHSVEGSVRARFDQGVPWRLME